MTRHKPKYTYHDFDSRGEMKPVEMVRGPSDMRRDDAIPQAGQCEATDWLPTADGEDAVNVRCQNVGKRVVEEMPLGGQRTRIVCCFHRGEKQP
jgi:hypothetical protein